MNCGVYSSKRKIIYLSFKDLPRNIKILALSSLGVAVGIACFIYFLALGARVTESLLDKAIKLPRGAIRVMPGSVKLGILNLKQPSLLGGVALDDEAVARITAVDGVDAAHPILNLDVPLLARGNVFGHRMRTDLVATGVPGALVAEHISGQTGFDCQGSYLPVVVSPQLLEMYNQNFAQANKLPGLTEQAVSGFSFELQVGRSHLAKTRGAPLNRKVKILGFSPFAVPMGVTMPLECVRKLNQHFGKPGDSYSSIIVISNSSSRLQQVMVAIEKMGFSILQKSKSMAANAAVAVTVITGLLSLVGVVIMALAVISITLIFYLLVKERRKEFAVMRALGASRNQVKIYIMTQALTVGTLAALAGIILSLLMMTVTEQAAPFLLDFLPFEADNLFQVKPVHILAALSLSIFFTALGAYFPSRRAANLDPAEALVD